MRTRSIAAALAAVALVACSSDTPETATTDSMAAPMPAADAPATTTAGGTMSDTAVGSLSDASTVTLLDQTIAAAQGGLTSVPAAAAVSIIRTFERRLDASDDPALDDIAKDLEKLREELSDDTVDGKDVASILSRLGPKVTAVAPKAGPAADRLRTLGGALTSAGGQLSK